MAKQVAAVASPQYTMGHNIQARNLVLANALEMKQQIAAASFVGTVPGQTINVPLRNVGLIKSIVIELEMDVAQGAAETQTRTALNGANILSNATFTDLANNNRINAPGWYLHHLATMRRQFAYGAAVTSDSPVGYGSNFKVMTVPQTVTTAQKVRFFYEIPLAYSDSDLRGAIFAQVINATMNLQFTINPNFFVGSTADPTNAVYKSSTAQLGTISNAKYKVYQIYLDQIPVGEQGYILPLYDLSTAYTINSTAFTGPAVNQDNSIPFSNFREFLSATLLYDNFGSSAEPGTEMTRLKLQSANYTNIFDIDPYYSSLLTRNIINDDLPSVAGQTMYYFDFRRKPLVTQQYGNLELIYQPNAVQGQNTQVLVGFESMAIINQVVNAGSLPAAT
jgi:hypothetical protein